MVCPVNLFFVSVVIYVVGQFSGAIAVPAYAVFPRVESSSATFRADDWVSVSVHDVFYFCPASSSLSSARKARHIAALIPNVQKWCDAPQNTAIRQQAAMIPHIIAQAFICYAVLMINILFSISAVFDTLNSRPRVLPNLLAHSRM